MLEIVILPSFSIFKYYNFVRVCSSDLFYFTCVMHVTRYYFIGCHSAQYRAAHVRRGIERRGNVQRGIVTKPESSTQGHRRALIKTIRQRQLDLSI